jgi:sulfatase maturation enzyme AslB (radical SAM superfamily)
MKPSTARKAVDMMLRTPASSITMEFQSGEPLLNFELKQLEALREELEDEYKQRTAPAVKPASRSRISSNHRT